MKYKVGDVVVLAATCQPEGWRGDVVTILDWAGRAEPLYRVSGGKCKATMYQHEIARLADEVETLTFKLTL